VNSMRSAESLVAHRVTNGPRAHFFGYYDKNQWDPSDRYLVGLETDFEDRQPTANDVARIVRIDTHDTFRLDVVAETRSWCWQQGCMLQWLPGSADEIIYNDRIGDRFVSVVLSTSTGRRRVLPRPVYTVSGDGTQALSLNFARLATTRPGYGYEGLIDQWAADAHPASDGIYRMDLATGDHELIVSIDALARLDADETMVGANHWVNHLLYNPSTRRFIFLHRWSRDGRSFRTRMYTAGTDGSDLHRVPIQDASHFIWFGDEKIIVWARTDRFGNAYHVCRDRTDKVDVLGAGILTKNGHCTVSPDEKWMLTDEYPDGKGDRPLLLYRLSGQGPDEERRLELGNFRSLPQYRGEIRCDLHPRWNRAGTAVCFDSVHEGQRQMYVMDVAALVAQ